MATTTTDLISAARALDPAGRALLNLWLHRGLDDAAIADLSGGSAQDVADRRRRLVELLAGEVGAPEEEVRAALDRMARGEPDPEPELVLPGEHEPGEPADLVLPGNAETEGESAAGDPADLVLPASVADHEPAASEERPPALILPDEPEEATERPAAAVVIPPAVDLHEAEPRPEPEPMPAKRRPARRAAPRRSAVPPALGFAVGFVIVALVAVAALTGGGGDPPESARPTPSVSPSQTPTQTPTGTPTPAATPSATPSATPTAASPAQALVPAPGAPSGVAGSATVTGSRLSLRVTGLEKSRADYEVWLFNSVADARPLGRLDEGPFRLPADRAQYRYLDVSLEPGDNPNHSGRSVLRSAVPR